MVIDAPKVYIVPEVFDHEISYITSHLTEEATEQVKLYGICDVALKITKDLESCTEKGTFLLKTANNHESLLDTPVAIYGLHTKTYGDTTIDHLFLVISSVAIDNYRDFSRSAQDWLSKREYPVMCTLPRISIKTLKMVKKWGFEIVSESIKTFQLMKYPPVSYP